MAKYNFIFIRRNLAGAGYDVRVEQDGKERMLIKDSPSGVGGCYFAPQEVEIELSFCKLKEAMIKHKKKLIKDLSEDIKSLQNLSLNQGQNNGKT